MAGLDPAIQAKQRLFAARTRDSWMAASEGGHDGLRRALRATIFK
jgi:hypothetical protein